MTAATRATAALVFVFSVAVAASISAQQASTFPQPADVEVYRKSVEPLFVLSRGGTAPGMAACVMCHTWQTSLRFALETPATNAGWTVEQSRRNIDIVGRVINTADPESSRLLRKPLAPDAGGLGHTGGTFWRSKEDPQYQAVLKWISSIPKDKYVAAKEPAIDFTFFRSCVQPVFQNPREGHIRCSNCHNAGLIGFAPVPADGKTWNDDEAKRAFAVITRLVVPGNPEQSRFLLKPLHPDGGGSYAHNGVRRWATRKDPEWQMLAGWVRGERTGDRCS
jgi:hypothetical protein